MDEKDIMQLITSEYSWEQIIYKIIAWEGMDPWNLDLSMLSRSFLVYVNKMKELDFKIPAKYVVIAAVLLRMKSDHIEYLKGLVQPPQVEAPELDTGEVNQVPETANGEINLALATLNVPSKRMPVRKIVASELISALRNALRTDERRSERTTRRRGQIVINEDNITERISELYKKIDILLVRLKEEEIEFSKLLNKWSRDEILDTFVPLVHLDHEKKVHCRQEDLFKEIYIKKIVPGSQVAKPEDKKPEAKKVNAKPAKAKKIKQAKAKRK